MSNVAERSFNAEMAQDIAPRAREWAEQALAELAAKTTDERRLWFATKPAGSMWFNHRRLKWVVSNLPEYQSEFQRLGLL
jgi:hypothetical protein